MFLCKKTQHGRNGNDALSVTNARLLIMIEEERGVFRES